MILAVFSTAAEEAAIYVVWRWLLPEFDINLSFSVLLGVMIAWGIFSISLFIFTTHTLKRQVPVGLPSMIGTRGKVAKPLNPEGMVRIKSELWTATSEKGDLAKGEDIEVVGEDGLRLVVRKIGGDISKR
jgi:membrane-bound serine protease (ClpP class)